MTTRSSKDLWFFRASFFSFPFSSSPSISYSFLFHRCTRKRSKIEDFCVCSAPWQYCYSFRLVPRPMHVVSEPVGQTSVRLKRSVLWSGKLSRVCPRSRKEESNFLAFLTPSFQSLDKSADRGTNDPLPPCHPFPAFCLRCPPLVSQLQEARCRFIQRDALRSKQDSILAIMMI